MGITIFIVFLVIAFFLGRRIGSYRKNKNNIVVFNQKKQSRSDSISPDANWIE